MLQAKGRLVFGRANFDVVRLRVLRRAYPSFPDIHKVPFVSSPSGVSTHYGILEKGAEYVKAKRAVKSVSWSR